MESNCTVDIFVEVAHISEDIFGDDIFTDDIFEEGAYNIEGFSGVVNFTASNEHCNHIEDTRVESVKVMSMFDSHK